MAASASCNSVGVAIGKLGRLVHQGSSNGAEGSLLHVDCKKRTDDRAGHLTSTSPLLPNNNQASRFASIAVTAMAWAGLSICPVEALAMAYEGEHRDVSESVFIMMGEFYEEEGNAEMEVATGNVPFIKPPNEGLTAPWVSQIDGLKKKDYNRASMRCPKWTESELEMVLPDFHGRPKPFPRMQGQLYPFWPALASTNNKGNYSSNYQDHLIENKFKQSNDEPLFVDESASATPNGNMQNMKSHTTWPSSPAPPPQQLNVPSKKPSCFTM